MLIPLTWTRGRQNYSHLVSAKKYFRKVGNFGQHLSLENSYAKSTKVIDSSTGRKETGRMLTKIGKWITFRLRALVLRLKRRSLLRKDPNSSLDIYYR